ncbi:hypothetical protein F441_13188 [Phytophthora nicotianae CJ01A1]|uniref:Uncharacterized protein n=1 Tax=Phytophthora nicotianae CJ01A1 TaxID=1317063 RepID=W2WMB9_PHYNI|nr:hypothetical protein F441_13188 [Phytophthora nicotianae CJ01A1]
MTRKKYIPSTISEKTVKLHLMRIFKSSEGRVAEELQPSFDIMLDGCTFNGRHFIAIFAVFNYPGRCMGARPSATQSTTTIPIDSLVVSYICPSAPLNQASDEHSGSTAPITNMDY